MLQFPSGSHYTTSLLNTTASASTSHSSLYRQLKSEEYSLRNRLKSIEEDRRFVEEISENYPTLALFANLRCGVWYLNTLNQQIASRQQQPCYFKSTDGHAHHTKFSDTRINVHLVKTILGLTQKQQQSAATSSAAAASHANSTTTVAAPTSTSSPFSPSAGYPGALIIDSTRKGKRFPDSFSRTIPIWCAVWNRAVAVWRSKQAVNAAAANATAAASSAVASTATTASSSTSTSASSPSTPTTDSSWDTALHLPSWISPMESDEIESRMSGFVSTLLGSGVDFSEISAHMHKPLRCLWMDRSSRQWENGDADFPSLSFTPLLLVQCSRAESETRGIGQRQGWSYIQGAGDDEENWKSVAGIKGFTPEMLSTHSKQLAMLDYDEEVIEYIKDVLVQENAASNVSVASSASSVASAASASNSTSVSSASLTLHRIESLNIYVLVSSSIPTCAAVTQYLASHPSSSAASSSSTTTAPSSNLALLYLYFDNISTIKQQRREKLAVEHDRKMKRENAGEDGEEEEEVEEEQALPTTEVPVAPTIDFLDWSSESRLAVPISSLSKSRYALRDIFSPALTFLDEQQISQARTVVLVCEDLSYVSCLCAAAALKRNAPAVASSASASSRVDKTMIRSTLVSIQSSLPSHFPPRNLLKQLNQLFLNHSA